jgi:DNA-binding NtrC family response regulator
MNTARLPQILICDDDSTFQLAVKYALKSQCECQTAMNGDEALLQLRNHSFDAVLLDVQIRSENEGLEYLPRIREADPEVAIIMSSGRTDFETVREAMKLGATDYVRKDFEPGELQHTLRLVLEKRALARSNAQKDYEALETQRKHPLIGQSPAIAQLRKLIEKVRASGANVLITGETGTGKEVVARQLRGRTPSGSVMPFVSLDSSTIQTGTAESLLFGHEKGAFTGANSSVKGVFEEADGGIVYFDEIGNMPLEIQAKLLRVLQEKEVTRLGSARSRQLEFRVIAATNKDLDAMCVQGQFKDDLLQRLNVLPVHLPPLRDRVQDIPLLLEHYLSTQSVKQRFSEESVELLKQYRWPGNVRELMSVVAYVCAMSETEEIEVADLPPRLRGPLDATHERKGSFYERVSRFEKELLSEAYAACGGNVSKIALQLEMDRSHLHSKLKEYGIHTPKR